MTYRDETISDNAALEDALAERERLLADYAARERDMLEREASARAERAVWWEQTVTQARAGAWGEQLSSYKSLAGSMAALLGNSVREQAKAMVPFEIAEATKEFARFLGTRDPSALASSLKHTLAAKQYAAAAKSGSAGSSQGGSGGGANASNATPQAEEPKRNARVIVNVGRQVGLVDTYEFARELIDAINENLGDDVVLEVSS